MGEELIVRLGFLLRILQQFYSRRPGRQQLLRHKEVVIVKIAIHASGNFGRFGAVGRAPALEEDNYDDVTDVGFGIRGKPSEASAGVRTGSGLAQNFLLFEIDSQAAGGAEMNGAFHAIGNLWNQGGDVKTAFHYWLKIGNLFGRSGMLQVIERAAIGYR